MHRTLRIAATLALLASVAACYPNFTPQSFIDKPRILGIRADPPEVQFSDEAQGTVTLTAFLALPELPKDEPPGPRRLESLEWSMCVLNLGATAGYKCALPETPLESDFEARTATFDGADLYGLLELIRPLMPDFIEFVKQTVAQDDECQNAVIDTWDACVDANGGDATACIDPGFEAERTCLIEKGQDITFHLKATWTDDAQPPGTPEKFVADAYKKAFFRPITAERPANRIPAFSLWVHPSKPLASVPVTSIRNPAPAVVVRACPEQKVTFEPIPDEDARETFLDTDGTTKTELLLFSWYTNAGEFERLKSSTATAAEGDAIDLTNVLELPKAQDFPATFPVRVFVRDDRLGLDGLEFQVQPRDASECTKPEGAPKDWKKPDPEVVLPEGGAA